MTSIEKLKLTPTFSAVVVKGKTQSVYLVFRDRMKAKETLRFWNLATEDRMLVDCGHDGYPIAVQFIFAKGIQPTKGRKSLSKDDFDRLVYALFMFATEMIRYNETDLQRKGNDLVKEATSVIKKVPSNKIKELSLATA